MCDFGAFFDALATTLEERYVKSKESSGHPSCDLPPNLANLLRVCYSASLRTEEHRQSTFSVVCANEAYAKRTHDKTPPVLSLPRPWLSRADTF